MNYIETVQTQLNAMATGFFALLPNLAIAIILLVITWFISKFAVRIANRLTSKTSVRDDLKSLTATVVRLTIWIIGLLLAAAVAIPGFTPAGMIAGLGVGALAIGFAFQDIFENFLAGVLIMLRDKMNLGDVIEVEGILGKVERITLRETHVRQLSAELTILPNAMLFKSPVKIFTDEPVRRNQLVIGVSYDTDLEAAKSIILSTVEGLEIIKKDRPVDVFAQEFNSSSIDFLVRFWVDSRPRDLRESKSQVIFAIKAALDDAGIEIPFPYVTHTFKEALPIERAAKAE